MKLLSITEEYRADTEVEAKEMMERYRERAPQENYIIKSVGYTHKEKKSKGEVIDEAYIVKAVKVYNGVWE